jgi:hypothetical protein
MEQTRSRSGSYRFFGRTESTAVILDEISSQLALSTFKAVVLWLRTRVLVTTCAKSILNLLSPS